ncbi:MAG: hypothetical protein HRK26_05260 [Rickettsiaceae bacterium H1]|nr:hypothetical protein [Rickettsiaceae bacterium H1]
MSKEYHNVNTSLFILMLCIAVIPTNVNQQTQLDPKQANLQQTQLLELEQMKEQEFA